MNQILKFKDNSINYYIGSDFHLNHDPKWEIPIWKSRGYDSVQEMNQDIINKINKRVKPDDVLFHLGDFSLNCSEEEFENFIGQIVCQNIYFLWGNHNSPSWNIYKREIQNKYNQEVEVYPFRYKNLIFVGNYIECFIHGQRITMNHYAQMIFNKSHRSAWHLTAHSHYGIKEIRADYPKGKILDVGWEGKKDIYSFNEIQKIMNKKSINFLGDHHNDSCF